MIDDSDVFSIRIDQRNSERVYASACSGIYGSSSAGATWTKLPGIPFDNRRTHVIAQDPKHRVDAVCRDYSRACGNRPRRRESGARPCEDSINALVLDPKGVMYLAVDQRGLLKSDDGGETFREINHGYVNRTITTMQTAAGRLRSTRSSTPAPFTTANGADCSGPRTVPESGTCWRVKKCCTAGI